MVLKEIAYCAMRNPDSAYNVLDFDSLGNLVDTEGCENLESAVWVHLRKLLSAQGNRADLLCTVANVILGSEPRHKLPSYVTEAMDTLSLVHLYMNYGRLEDAGIVLLGAVNRKEYVDPVVYAKVCEALAECEKSGAETAPALSRLRERLAGGAQH